MDIDIYEERKKLVRFCYIYFVHLCLCWLFDWIVSVTKVLVADLVMFYFQ
jgi:hypothetical protein